MPTREEMNSVARDIISSYESRVKGVSQIRQATQAQLQELDGAHNAMAQELRAGLSKVKPALADVEAARRQDEAQRGRERAQVVAQRKSDVSAQLKELDGAHNAMAQELRAELSKVKPALADVEAARRQDEAQRGRERARVVAQRKSDVSAQLGGYRDEQAGARAAWQELTTTMQAKRGVLVVERPPEAAPVAGKVEEEEEEARAEAEEATAEFAAVRDRVFAYLADHPDGVRLVHIERQFGLSRLEASRVVRSLINEGKSRKQDLLYFAT